MEDIKPNATTPQAEANNSCADDIPADVRPYDILCGRSNHCFNNIGNRRFRITISMNVEKYDTITNRTERGKFIVSLARTFKEDVGFRFVRFSKKHGRVELCDEEIRAKIGHALRDLSKTKAAAAAAAESPLVTEEANMIIGSSKPSLKIVTREPLYRRVTNYFETDSLGMLKAFPQWPDNRKETMMDASAPAAETSHKAIPQVIIFSPRHQHHHQDVLEEAQLQSTKIQTDASFEQPMVSPHQDKPTPKLAFKPTPLDKAIGDDDYCLMFDEPSNANGLLEAINMDVLPGFAIQQMMPKSGAVSVPNMIFRSAFDDDDANASIASIPFNNEVIETTQQRNGFVHMIHQYCYADKMSVASSDDYPMIGLCESVDSLSLDLDFNQPYRKNC